MRRRLLAAALLAFLAASAGCAAFGSGRVDESALSKDVAYDWEVTADATYTVETNRYEAVFRIENATTFAFYRLERFDEKRPVDPIGLKFRYPNGTVRTLPASAVSKRGSKTRIDLPANDGLLAFSVSKQGKRVRIPVVLEGSHVVRLPPGARVQYPIIGHVVPRGYERIATGDLVRLRWGSVDAKRLVVRYYLERDLLILGSLIAVAGVVAVVGSVRYWLRIKQLRARREAVEVEYGDGDR